jgi:hypothetical protein
VRSGRPLFVKLAGLALAAGIAATVSGCAQPSYRFVGSDDRDLVIRVPRSWTPIDHAAAVKAAGLDGAAQSGWTTFYDAAPKPNVVHVADLSTDDPVLFAESIPLTPEQRAIVSGNDLRELILPLTPELRAQAFKAKILVVLENQTLARPTENGSHIRYSYVVGGNTEIFDRIVLADPKLHAVHVLFVHCTQKCYARHAVEIHDVVTSLTLKPS